MTIYLIITYSILLIMLIIGLVIDHRTAERVEKLQDQADREYLGKKYYEELYGKGSWETKK